MGVKVLRTDEYLWQGLHPLQQQRAAQGLPPQAGADTRTSVFLRLRGKWLRSVAAADDGGLHRVITVPTFHVSQNLFADAEVVEDYVEQIFDVDAAGDAAEGAGGQSNVFGDEIGVPGL